MSLLCDNVKRLRLLRGLTQKQLAGILGVSPKTVSKWETGLGQPEVNQIVPLARVFGVSTDELFLGPQSVSSVGGNGSSETRSIQKELDRISTQYRIPLELMLQTAGAGETDLKELIEGKIPTDQKSRDKQKRLTKLIIVFSDLIPRYVEDNALLISTLFSKLRLENELPAEAVESYAHLSPGRINAYMTGRYPMTQKEITHVIATLFMLDISINRGEAFPMDEV